MPIVTTFNQTRFLGASIASFSTQIGWNEQSTSLTVSLVEDTSTVTTKRRWASYSGDTLTPFSAFTTTTTADSFAPPSLGSPVHFRFDDFIFNGVLQSWEKKNDFNGIYYECTVHGATEILSAVQLIIGGYSGTVSAIPNLINVFGYYEDIDFGAAQVNEAGIPWAPTNAIGLKSGINALINTTTSAYTGKMWLKNQRYLINLTNLPATPVYYRIGGNSVNLLEVISQVCQDAGFDYYVDLTYNYGTALDNTNSNAPVITFKTVSRQAIPDLNLLKDFIDARTDAGAKSRGREFRNEETVAFMVGGQQERLYTQYLALDSNPANNTIWPYWGLDAQGNAIISSGINDANTFTLDTRQVNCSGVGATYSCNVGEIRAAMADMDSWMSYIGITNPDREAALGLAGRLNMSPEVSGILQRRGGTALDLANTNIDFAEMSKDDTKQEGILNLFSFIEGIGSEYYGKKFMVRLNNLPEAFQVASEPDTNRMMTSYEPIEAGYLDQADWLLGNRPLRFPAVYEDMFTTEEGKWNSFVYFQNASGLDLKNLSPEDCIVYNQNNAATGTVLYVKTGIEPFFVYGNAAASSDPRAVLTLPGSVNARVAASGQSWGPAQMIVKAIIQVDGGNPITDTPTAGQMTRANNLVDVNSSAHFPYDFGAEAQAPLAAVVPLRDNLRTYGPWSAAGAAASGGGKVRFEQNTELVPWNFNGYTFMNNAGNAQIVNICGNQQEAEMGHVELVGSPIVQLGDALVSGGPNVTGIDLNIGPNGVSTNYTLRTYTPGFGGFSKQQADTYQRLSRVSRENTRAGLKNLRSINSVPASYFSNREGLYTSKGLKGNKNNSPHTVIFGSYFDHPVYDEGDVECSGTQISFGTIEEGLASLHVDKYKYQAIASLDSLFAPYSAFTGSPISHFQRTPYTGGTNYGQGKSVEFFNPFTPNARSTTHSGVPDITLAAFSSVDGEYPDNGLQSLRNKITETSLDRDVRSISLKGPIIVSAWGYDIFGRPCPNVTSSGLPTLVNDGFIKEFLHKPYTWKTGPLNMRWNPIIGMWDSPYGLYKCTYLGVVGGTGMAEYNSIRLPIKDYYDLGSIDSGTKIIVGMCDDSVTVISAEC